MRLLSVSQLQPGMKLGKRIFNEDGMVLLSENVELSERLIRRLHEIGVAYVYIQDPHTDDIHIPEMLQDKTRQHALKEIKKQFRLASSSSSGSSVSYLGKSFGSIMSSILDDIGGREDAMIMLMNMGTTDQDLYQHSLTVCVYTLVLGIANGYTKSELLDLGMGALLHDIGKTRIPQHILLKPDRLTDAEYEQVKQHTTLGYQILKDEPNVSSISALCALQHHERIDGSGYPHGLARHEIHDYSKLLALVDSYDAMTANRSYREPLLPHQAVDVLYTGAGTLYEQRILEMFRDCVAIYPPGLTVRLSTGEEGVVVRIHKRIPQRPIIRVLKSADGQELSTPYELDLSVVLSVMITDAEGLNRPHSPPQL
ncbi:HD-GYP domain-containing protein [Paenibacillus massiliensis]|uniref:HD-GYP domain-containing protein n=1 Tax=Paenibacillus massiliensis TaxID=225917 RepID=UPI00037FE4A9